MKNFLAIALLVVVVMSCKDSGVAPNRVILKVTAQTPGDFNWIIIKDNETGELLGVQQLTAATTIFESTKSISGNKLMVTYFQSSGLGGSARVYRSIDVGSEWTISSEPRYKSDPNAPSIKGYYALIVGPAPDPFSFTISDEFSPVNVNAKLVYNVGLGKITIDPGFRTGYKQLISIDPVVGKAKYLFIDKINGGENIYVDYTDFKEFDKYVKVDFPLTSPAWVYVTGSKTSSQYYNGWGLYETNHDDRKSEINIGFLNELQTYRISVIASEYSYNYLGPLPTAIKPQANSASFNIIDRDLLNYAIKADVDYSYSRSIFYTSGSPFLSVEYFEPKGDVKHFDPFTDEITKTNSLDLSRLNYVGTQVTVGTQSYSRFIDFLFAAEADYDASQPYETTSIYYDDSK